jgi:hypothetical protein
MKKFILDLYKGIKYSLKSLKEPSFDLIKLSQIKLKENFNSKQKFLFLNLDDTILFTEKDSKYN